MADHWPRGTAGTDDQGAIEIGGPLFRDPMSRRRWVGLAGSMVIPIWWMATWWWYLNIL